MKRARKPPSRIPKAPEPLPSELNDSAAALVEAWLEWPARPKIGRDVAIRWHGLISQWLDDAAMPLFARKSAGTWGGYRKDHPDRPEGIVHCDNSPAQWVMRKCLNESYDRSDPVTYETLTRLVTSLEFPLNMVMDRAGKEDEACLFKRSLRPRDGISSQFRYHTAHVIDVGLADKTEIPSIAISALKLHFLRLMSPLNMLLVPMELKGLADLNGFKKPAFRANSEEYGSHFMVSFKPDHIPSGFIAENSPKVPDA